MPLVKIPIFLLFSVGFLPCSCTFGCTGGRAGILVNTMEYLGNDLMGIAWICAACRGFVPPNNLASHPKPFLVGFPVIPAAVSSCGIIFPQGSLLRCLPPNNFLSQPTEAQRMGRFVLVWWEILDLKPFPQIRNFLPAA